MPKFASSQEWLEQSALLLKAYPTNTRITTKYNIPHPTKVTKQRKRKAAPGTDETTAPQPAAATLEVRTYNPDAGVVLKYQTNKGWEVGRLMASLGRLGRHMAALPEIAEDEVKDEAKEELKEEVQSGTHTPVPEASKPVAGGQQGGGKKNKKKWKR